MDVLNGVKLTQSVFGENTSEFGCPKKGPLLGVYISSTFSVLRPTDFTST